MIGNDIVDLALAKKESNWQRKGFVEKIFTPSEQLMIFNSDEPEVIVWYLWSQKESAYKIYNRQTKVRAYMPLKFECFHLEIKSGIHYGKVSFDNHTYFTKSTITKDCINTVAVVNPSDFENITPLKSTTKIEKENGIPGYYSFQNTQFKPLSKSHHGRYEQIVTLTE